MTYRNGGIEDMNHEVFQNVLISVVLGIVLATLAYLLREHKQRIIKMAESFIQEAESAVEGTSMGEEKKKLVTARLEACGIKVNKWLSTTIDCIVEGLNSSGAWLIQQAKNDSGLTIKEVLDHGTGQ